MLVTVLCFNTIKVDGGVSTHESAGGKYLVCLSRDRQSFQGWNMCSSLACLLESGLTSKSYLEAQHSIAKRAGDFTA